MTFPVVGDGSSIIVISGMELQTVWGSNADTAQAASCAVNERPTDRFIGSVVVGSTIFPFSIKIFCEVLCLCATAAAC